jgi:hypothetical protein
MAAPEKFSIADTVKEALAHHQGRRWGEADRLYRHVLERRSPN